MRAATLLVVAALLCSNLLPAGLPRASAATGPAQASGALAPGDLLYSQSPRASGGLLRSSVRVTGRSDGDRWVWDAFTLQADSGITEIHWTGGYDPAGNGSGGPVVRFAIGIYATSKFVNEPDLSGPLVVYSVEGDAGESSGPVLGNVQMYDYAFTLPTPFQVTGGTQYWVQIEAFQGGDLPDWGLTSGAGGDGFYFRRVGGSVNLYQRVSGDAAFALYGVPASGGGSLFLPTVVRG